MTIIYQNKYGIPISHWYYLLAFSLDLNALMVRTYSAFFSFFCLIWSIAKLTTNSSSSCIHAFFAMRLYSVSQGKGRLFLSFLNLDLGLWQVLPNEKLENLIQTDAWQVLEHWGSSWLAILRNSDYRHVNESQLAYWRMSDAWCSYFHWPWSSYSPPGMWMKPSTTNWSQTNGWTLPTPYWAERSNPA